MRGKMKFLFAGLCLAFAVTALAPSSAAAQGQICGLCTDEVIDSEYAHVFGQSGAMFTCEPGSMGCHYADYAWGYCGNYHEGGCAMASLDALTDLQDAIDSGDRIGALSLVITRSKHIAFDYALNEFTVSLCNGETLAVLALPSE